MHFPVNLVKGQFGKLLLAEDVAYILLTLMLRLTQSTHSTINPIANPNAMDKNQDIV